MRHRHPLPGLASFVEQWLWKEQHSNPGKSLRMNSSWMPTNDSCVLLIHGSRDDGGGVEWEGRKPRACGGLLLFWPPGLSLPFFSSDVGRETVRVKEAFGLHLDHFRWVLFKGSFALLEHPRTTGCSLSKWVLNTYSVAAYISQRCSSLVTQRKGPDSFITPHSFLQRIHFFFHQGTLT